MKSTSDATFSDRLNRLMKDRHLKQDEVAEMVGLTQAAVSLWLKGKTPYLRNIIPLCMHLEINEDWLLNGTGTMELSTEDRRRRDETRATRKKAINRLVGALRDAGRNLVVHDPDEGTERTYSFSGASDDAWSYVTAQVQSLYSAFQADELPPEAVVPNIIQFPAGHRLRPVVGNIAAGMPQEAIAETNQWVALPPKQAADTTYILKVQGDSMIDKGIYHGDLVRMTTKKEPRNGDVVAALCDHETCLKTFVAKAGQRPILRAENKKFPPEIIPADELIIQGVMLGKVRS